MDRIPQKHTAEGKKPDWRKVFAELARTDPVKAVERMLVLDDPDVLRKVCEGLVQDVAAEDGE